MSTPNYYDPSQIAKLYDPDFARAIAEGQNAGWTPAALDGTRRNGITDKTCLWIVDPQRDFCVAGGSLYVPGSEGDLDRIIRFIYERGDRITTIVVTMDWHLLFSIFFSSWWIDKQGRHPDPYTQITAADIRAGLWQPLVEPAWSAAYPTKLEGKSKKTLMIWPYHCMQGTPGAAIVPALAEALVFHSAARHSQTVMVMKGHFAQTEYYSPLEPEVPLPNIPGGMLNTNVLKIFESHRVLVCGEASSHCVLEGMYSVVNNLPATALQKILYLTDCTSPVLHPAVDFPAITKTAMEEMRNKHGIQLTTSLNVKL